jgi:hypothetical protein
VPQKIRTSPHPFRRRPGHSSRHHARWRTRQGAPLHHSSRKTILACIVGRANGRIEEYFFDFCISLFSSRCKAHSRQFARQAIYQPISHHQSSSHRQESHKQRTPKTAPEIIRTRSSPLIRNQQSLRGPGEQDLNQATTAKARKIEGRIGGRHKKETPDHKQVPTARLEDHPASAPTQNNEEFPNASGQIRAIPPHPISEAHRTLFEDCRATWEDVTLAAEPGKAPLRTTAAAKLF